MTSYDSLAPVFILGAGRSGTKFLRGLLEVSEDVVAVPYDIGFVWRYGNETIDHDEFTSEMADKRVVDYVRKTLPKLVDKKKKNPRFLIEKSVPNTLRVEFLHKIYPEAKFIHLVRDGRAVTESSIRMWKSPVSSGYMLKKIKYFPWSNYKYALWYLGNMIKGKFASGRGCHVWGPRYKGIEKDVSSLPLEAVCARQWRKSVDLSTKQLAVIPEEQVTEIRYENLVSSDSEIKRLCQFIGISDVDTVVENYKKNVKVSNAVKWKKFLYGEKLKLVDEEIGELLNVLGYRDEL